MNPIVFVDHAFISSTPLTSLNVLDYFSRSPFYDSTCTNEILKMQNQYRGIISYEGIEKLNGMYYTLEHSSDFLFIIRCSLNNNGKTENLKFYYIIYGYIYEGPSSDLLYKNRVNNIFWYLNQIIDYHVENIFDENYDAKKCNKSDDQKLKKIVEDVHELLNKEM